MIHPLLFLQNFRKFFESLHIGPLKFSDAAAADTVMYTWLLILFLLIVSFLATKAIKTVPGGLQNFMELIVGGIENMVVETMGEHGRPFFPLIATLALFILVSNLIGLIPGFYPPTANVNTTAACAFIVFFATHIVGIKKHGLHYVKHFMGPILWLAPLMFVIEVVSHLSRVLSLTLRLFGNMFGHEMVLMSFFFLGIKFYAPIIPLPMMMMGILVSFIQAFVFMLLAMIYIHGSLEEAH